MGAGRNWGKVNSSNQELSRVSPAVRAGVWRRWAPFALVLLIVIGAVFAADFRKGGAIFAWIERHPGSDKVAHFLLLGTLAFSLNCALQGRRARIGPCVLLLGGVLVGVGITVEEFSQLWIPGRTFDWRDLAANYAGIACADWLARRWLR
jgi:polysaccharide biosynthesis protein VpsQ